MRGIAARLPFSAEFAIVVTIAFGSFILSSVFALLYPSGSAPISEGGLAGLLIFEPALAAFAMGFLYLRGWDFHRFGFKPGFRATAEGIALAAAAWLIYATVYLSLYALGLLDPALLKTDLVHPGITPGVILAASVVNPLFEETFVAGYIISALKDRKSTWFAINASVAVRLSYHLYQGPLAPISVIPLGLAFAFWYARTGRLWPLVVAHGIFDFAGLWMASGASNGP